MNFKSDNVTGAAPDILNAVIAANDGTAPSYGDDEWTIRLQGRLTELFSRPVWAFPVLTGTAANALALAALTPPWGAVYCHADAHIHTDECGAPELFTGGAKLVTLGGVHGRLSVDDLHDALAAAGAGFVHHVQPAVLSLSQATEAGTVYTADQVATLAEVARQHQMAVHMDGARFANAVVGLGADPADLTWRAGVDVLSLGATKNGALAAELVVFFRQELAQDFGYRRKRAAHLISKMRFVSAQLDAWLADGLWLRLAAHANAMATRLAQGLTALPGARLRDPVQANEVFIELPEPIIAGLEAAGFQFYRWSGRGQAPAQERQVIRLVTAWNTTAQSVTDLCATAGRLAAKPVG